MGFELIFWWEREGIGNHFTNLYFKMGIAPSLNETYEECRTVGVGVISVIHNISKGLIISFGWKGKGLGIILQIYNLRWELLHL